MPKEYYGKSGHSSYGNTVVYYPRDYSQEPTQIYSSGSAKRKSKTK